MRRTVQNLLYRSRVLLLVAVIAGIMSVLVPEEFPTWSNVANIIRSTSTDALAAVGFTLVMLTGQLDLSVGAVMTLGGAIVMFAQPALGWTGAVLFTGFIGLIIGLFNGLLVAKAKINSFIVTLGTMTILTGLTRVILQGGSKSLDDVSTGMAMVDWLNPVMPWSPRALIIFLPILLLAFALRRTVAGRNVLLIGGNREAAWVAGIRVDRYVVGVFMLAGLLSAFGGAFTAMAQNTAMPNLGDKSLMLIVAATIVGGTSMAGGRGSVLMTVVALAGLNALTNGLSYMGASKSVKLIAHGSVLAAVIIYDAWRQVQKDRIRGQRHELLEELENIDYDYNKEEEDTDMNGSRKDKLTAMVCITAIACTAMVLIYAMWSRRLVQTPVVYTPASQTVVPATASVPAGEEVDVTTLLATDGQPLVAVDDMPLIAPERPEDPTKLPDDDLLRWYDYEYAGWKIKKLPMPKSPGTGPAGKKVVSLQYMDHPYWTGYGNGMKRLAKVYGMDLITMEAGNDNKVQMDQVEQAIRMKPDMVILTPVDSNGVVPMLKRLHDEGIPTIASNLLPVDEGMKYVITWTGPDDWRQIRMLAREFADKLGYTGNYCVIRHVAGTSCYLSRTWAAVSELKKIAPAMKCLDMQSTDLKSEESKKQVLAWIKKYGKDLKGIVSADDSKAQVGIAEALKDAGREDIVCVAAGASRTGLNYIKEGKLHAITYQSAEADGALPIEIAARWFKDEPVDQPVYYLQKAIITKDTVDQYFPAQW
jgi:ribose transport system substrate-binding protein